MKQRSASLGTLPASSRQSPRMGSLAPKLNPLNYHSRLQFPILGDTRFYGNYGRKHYKNQSDRVLKIILPREYPARQPALSTFARENSLPLPSPQKLAENYSSQELSPIRQPKSTKASNLGVKVNEELDKMRQQMQRQKLEVFISKKFQKNNEEPVPQQKKQTIPKLPGLQQGSVPASPSRREGGLGYLLTPLATKLVISETPRLRNPSFLSSGLSIV